MREIKRHLSTGVGWRATGFIKKSQEARRSFPKAQKKEGVVFRGNPRRVRSLESVYTGDCPLTVNQDRSKN
jgi:hypothetical protein